MNWPTQRQPHDFKSNRLPPFSSADPVGMEILCRDCGFFCASVDDYAKHYAAFHPQSLPPPPISQPPKKPTTPRRLPILPKVVVAKSSLQRPDEKVNPNRLPVFNNKFLLEAGRRALLSNNFPATATFHGFEGGADAAFSTKLFAPSATSAFSRYQSNKTSVIKAIETSPEPLPSPSQLPSFISTHSTFNQTEKTLPMAGSMQKQPSLTDFAHAFKRAAQQLTSESSIVPNLQKSVDEHWSSQKIFFPAEKMSEQPRPAQSLESVKNLAINSPTPDQPPRKEPRLAVTSDKVSAPLVVPYPPFTNLSTPRELRLAISPDRVSAKMPLSSVSSISDDEPVLDLRLPKSSKSPLANQGSSASHTTSSDSDQPKNTLSSPRTAGKPDRRKKTKCDCCWADFPNETDLLEHRRETHANEARPFRCSECPAQFKRMRHRNSHQKRHLSVWSKFECKTCDRKYSRKHSLDAHLESCARRKNEYEELKQHQLALLEESRIMQQQLEEMDFDQQRQLEMQHFAITEQYAQAP